MIFCRIRETLSAMLMLSVNVGILFGFILSSHFEYYLVPTLTLSLPIIYLVGSYFFPETPQHLLRKKMYDNAEKSFQFYRNCNNDNKSQCCDIFENFKFNIEKSNQQDSLSHLDFGKYHYFRLDTSTTKTHRVLNSMLFWIYIIL